MMQTNGPVRDYARYVTASTNKLLRPLSSSETTDACLSLYRQYFSRLISLSYIPTLYISGFAIVFYNLIFPRLFETEYTQDTNLQVFEFCAFLFVGMTIGVAVANIGLAQLATYSDTIVKASLLGEDLGASEIKRRSSGLFATAYKSTFRASWYLGGILALSFAPLIAGGFLLSVTSDENSLPGIVSNFAFLTVPIGLLVFIIRMGIGMGIVSIAVAEKLTPKFASIRSQYLLGSKTRPSSNSNPAVNGVITSGVLYLFLRGGYSLLDNQVGFRESILNLVSEPMFKVSIDIFIGLLPEMIAILFTTPFIALAAAYFYYQRRISVEGMDIEALYEKLPANRR